MPRARKETSGARPPSLFLQNNRCIEYELAQAQFLQQYIFTPATKRKIKANAELRAKLAASSEIPEVYRLLPSYYLIDCISICRRVTKGGGIKYTDEVINHIVRAVEWFGIDAIRLNSADMSRIHPMSSRDIALNIARQDAWYRVLETYLPSDPLERQKNPAKGLTIEALKKAEKAKEQVEIPEGIELPKLIDPLEYLHPLARAAEEIELVELRYREALGEKVCDVLRHWRDKIKNGTNNERTGAARNLRRFANALVPETRGKRKNVLTATHYEVKKFYLKQLFRLYHVENALKANTRGLRNYSLRVKEVSENFDIPLECLREFRGLNENDEPYRQPLSPKDMARDLTARHFGITQHRVSNIISGEPHQISPK